jgi:protein-S-isoprenylcysteine O-methyltransferase Ste14
VYDILIALPLVAFYVRGARGEFPRVLFRVAQLLDGTATLTGTLQMLALAASILFSLLLILLIFARSVPVGKSAGIVPRLVAVAGTFAGTAFLYLEPIALPLSLQIIATLMTMVGMLLSFLVLLKLGRSFSIMPEARRLITTGPYAIVRHPLYMVEEIAVFGMLIQFAGTFALGFAIGHVTLQYMRSVYEEQVLEATFADYGAYRLRTRWRFIPGLI